MAIDRDTLISAANSWQDKVERLEYELGEARMERNIAIQRLHCEQDGMTRKAITRALRGRLSNVMVGQIIARRHDTPGGVAP